MKFSKKLLALAVAMVLGCQNNKSGNTTTGNPMISMAITGASSSATVLNMRHQFNIFDLFIQTAFAFPAPTSMVDANGNTVVLSQNWINLGEIEFKTSEVVDSGEIDGSDVDFQGPYAIDMFSTTPQLLGFNIISVDQVRRIKIKLIRTTSTPSGAPVGFLGKSIYISGQVNGQTFSFSTTDESEIQVAGSTVVTPTANKAMLLELKTANLIKKIDLSAITTATNIDDSNKVNVANPCPNIDASATDLFTCFRKGLESESNLGRDDDGNFHLDTNEDTVK